MIVIAQLVPKVELTARQQLGLSDWELAENVVKVLKPFWVATTEIEGNHAYISDVIPSLKNSSMG